MHTRLITLALIFCLASHLGFSMMSNDDDPTLDVNNVCTLAERSIFEMTFIHNVSAKRPSGKLGQLLACYESEYKAKIAKLYEFEKYIELLSGALAEQEQNYNFAVLLLGAAKHTLQTRKNEYIAEAKARAQEETAAQLAEETKKLVFAELVGLIKSLVYVATLEDNEINKKTINTTIAKNLTFWHKFDRGICAESSPDNFQFFFDINFVLVTEATSKFRKTGDRDLLRVLTSYNMDLLKELKKL